MTPEHVYYTLTHDQCIHGFAHTQREIILWLCGCDTKARKDLLAAIKELDVELDSLGR